MTTNRGPLSGSTSTQDLEFDRERLFAAALLHDTGLPTPAQNVDFTLASARVARDVAEDVELSTAATQTMRTAITLHHSPNVTLVPRDFMAGLCE